MTIKRLLRQFSLLMVCVIFTQIAFSQTKTITGKVVDDKGNPVSGATISVRGARGGTTTDNAGLFKLSVSGTGKSLLVSFVGFAQQEISIGDRDNFTVSLVPSTQALTDVVVIGYGNARSRSVTGSVATVKAKDFNSGVTSAEELLTGKVPGLQIADNSGQPGGTINVKIRGNNSISSTSNPLYVVDGVPIDATSPIAPDKLNVVGNVDAINGLIFLDPGNIASITVLKDASASAIYGARGENGVILIETNKGSGRTQIDAGVRVITGGGLMKNPDLLSASEYRAAIAKYDITTDSGLSLNPFKTIIQNKLSSIYNVAISGGGDNGKFRASFSANDQQGYILKSGLQKYVASFAGEHYFIDKRLKIGFNVGVSNYKVQVAPTSNEAGSNGNLISQA